MSATVTNCLDDTSAANHLVPTSDTQLTISCDDAGTCVNTVDATLDTPDGVRACIVVSGQGHTIQADSAVAVQTRDSMWDSVDICSPIRSIPFELIHPDDAEIVNLRARAAWLSGRGTHFTFSFCQERWASTVICTYVTDSESDVGKLQHCGACVMVYLGSKADTSCGFDEERRFYESVCRIITDLYGIYQLAFTDFEVRYVAVINGTAWNLWEEQPAGTVLSLSTDFENPFTDYQMARQGHNYSAMHVSPVPMDRTDCNGYCGLAGIDVRSLFTTMYGNCVTPNSDCRISTSTRCTATVQSFVQSKAGSALPLTVSGATLSYNGTNYIVNATASAIPLRGSVTLSVPNAERVLPSEAATNVNGIVTTLLPQDADHEDVVVVYTDGAVATASRDCAFTLLETRDKNRMYSMRNVRNVTECDLLVSNGASERSLSVAAQTTKNSGVMVVENATALWPAHPPGSESPPPGTESRSSGLTDGEKAGIGVSAGVVGLIVILAAIYGLYYWCCRKPPRRPVQNEPEAAENPNPLQPAVEQAAAPAPEQPQQAAAASPREGDGEADRVVAFNQRDANANNGIAEVMLLTSSVVERLVGDYAESEQPPRSPPDWLPDLARPVQLERAAAARAAAEEPPR